MLCVRVNRRTILSAAVRALVFGYACGPLPGSAKETTSQPKFQTARPGYQFRFPRDHGTHDDFQTEWWYYTGHLRTTAGRSFGYQLTFFRRAMAQPGAALNPSRWALRQLYFAHFAVTDEQGNRFRFAEKLSRAGLGKAGAASGRLAVWIDDWRSVQEDQAHHLRARDEATDLDLRLTPEKPAVVHGIAGVSRKGERPEEASHYYSFTRMRTEGTLSVAGSIVSVSGVSWMDHEFGSNQLGEEQAGWDWFSLQLNDQTELMLYQIRRQDGSVEPASGGTWVRQEGSAAPLTREDVRTEVLSHWESVRSKARYPARWRISVPSLRLALEVVPVLPDQELLTESSTQVAYWEGSVTVHGERAGQPVSGVGYAELTGYAAPLGKRL